MSTEIQAVVRAVDLLELLRHSGALGVSDIATQLDLPVATVHRLARTLVSQGLLSQLPDRRYGLGSRLVAFGTAANESLGLRARPELTALARELAESANLAAYSAGVIEYIAQVPGPQSMRMFTEVGRRVPVHSTGVGKAILATMGDAEVTAILAERGMAPSTPQTITDPHRMLDELAHIREVGYAIDEGEMELGVRCIAVAFDAVTPMAVSVSGPSGRLTGETFEAAVPRVLTAAKRLHRLFAAE